MPNWAEGNIRFRGKPENIMAFLKNELECTATERGFVTVSFPPDVDWNDLDEVTLSEPEEERNKPGRNWKSFYIRSTRRNFIDVIAGVYLPRDAKEWIIILDSFKAAWCCFAEPYIEKSKKYGIDAARLVAMEAPTIGGWISVEDRLPEDDRAVLAVKQLKNGRRDMCLARCIPDYECYDVETRSRIKRPYWVCGGNNNIIYWMPLPDMPKEDT